MEFRNTIKLLGDKVSQHKEQIQTEEATKNAFIMPFLQAIGYDVFNPMEVVPEFTSDIGLKKGEKVDYAIMKDGTPIILIECKWHGANLNLHDSQLLRYFHTSKAKFGLLTNGIVYRFYTDLVSPNIMDEKPFLEFDITNIKEQHFSELKKFHKSNFDADSIFSSAAELKYINQIKNILKTELEMPSDAFVKFFVGQVYQGRATEKVLAQFTDIVKKSHNQFISDIINDRLKNALDSESEKEQELVKLEAEKKSEEKSIITTDDEKEAFFIVKSILRAKINCERIIERDLQGFFAVIIDDSIRQTVCRFYFSNTKKVLSIIDEAKKETKFELEKLDDIFNYSQQLLLASERYVK